MIIILYYGEKSAKFTHLILTLFGNEPNEAFLNFEFWQAASPDEFADTSENNLASENVVPGEAVK